MNFCKETHTLKVSLEVTNGAGTQTSKLGTLEMTLTGDPMGFATYEATITDSDGNTTAKGTAHCDRRDGYWVAVRQALDNLLPES